MSRSRCVRDLTIPTRPWEGVSVSFVVVCIQSDRSSWTCSSPYGRGAMAPRQRWTPRAWAPPLSFAPTGAPFRPTPAQALPPPRFVGLASAAPGPETSGPPPFAPVVPPVSIEVLRGLGLAPPACSGWALGLPSSSSSSSSALVPLGPALSCGPESAVSSWPLAPASMVRSAAPDSARPTRSACPTYSPAFYTEAMDDEVGDCWFRQRRMGVCADSPCWVSSIGSAWHGSHRPPAKLCISTNPSAEKESGAFSSAWHFVSFCIGSPRKRIIYILWNRRKRLSTFGNRRKRLSTFGRFGIRLIGLSSCPEALASHWSGGRDELALVKLLARTGATSESGINNFTFAYVRLGGAGPLCELRLGLALLRWGQLR